MNSELPALQKVADAIIAAAFGVDPATWPLTELVYLAFMGAAAGAVFGFALNFAGFFIFFERRIAARMQSRIGPNRVGPQGLLQFMVDGLKCLFKEDLVPTEADQPLFRMAPYFVVLGMVLAFAAMPFSSALIATDINIGILFVLGVTSLVVIGVLMGGWGSNSKWALLGGMRSAAQVISYEIPAGLAAMTVIIISGSLSMQDLIAAQGGDGIVSWGIFHSPFTVAAFFVFFVAQLAEGNRTPFDLPEAESELVSGYNTEYSGMRFLMFFLGEFANVWILCAVSVALFLGGWQIPFGTLEDGMTPSPWLVGATGPLFAVMLAGASIPAAFIGVQIFRYRSRAHAAIDRAKIPGMAPGLTRMALHGGLDGAMLVHLLAAVGLVGAAAFQLSGGFAETFEGITGFAWAAVRAPIAINGLQFGVFVAKTLGLVFIVIQLRWTLPRIRVDQMMTLCWKYLVPISFACMLGVLVWELVVYAVPILGLIMRVAMFFVVVAVFAMYVKKIKASYDVDKDNYENFTGESAWHPPWKLV
ncbi:MAG: complex I subunit 1 family protein [Deltaproteobacteria bacterium]|jgi:NADH:ubiquinone oxidoreductase subunit H